jgi:hypothetical protein
MLLLIFYSKLDALHFSLILILNFTVIAELIIS